MTTVSTRSHVTVDLLSLDAQQRRPATPSVDAREFTPADQETVDRIAAGLCLLRYRNDQDRQRARANNPTQGQPA